MYRKSIITMIFVGVITLAIAVPASWAGSRAKHRMEGVVIGVGAMILAKAIIDHHHEHDAAYHAPKARYHPRRYNHHRAGYWDVQKVWIPPHYKKVWNPGHYKRSGKWVPGRWIKIQDRPGYWSTKRIWVSTYR